MKVIQASVRWGGVAVLGLALAACATVDAPTRALSLDVPGLAPAPRVIAPQWAVQEVRVVVPDTLSISERDGFFPTADIVWHGDPPGDRHDQIAALFQEAAQRLQPQLDGPVPAVATITVARFHGVTERTRTVVEGVHAIRFVLDFSDPSTGRALAPPLALTADMVAPRGVSAADERARVVDHLTQVLAGALAGTAG